MTKFKTISQFTVKAQSIATQSKSKPLRVFKVQSYKFVKRWLSLCSTLKLVPYETAQENEPDKFQLFRKKWQSKVFNSILWLLGAISIVNLCSCIQYLNNNGIDGSFIISVYFIQGPIIAAMFFLANRNNPQECVKILNESSILLKEDVRNDFTSQTTLGKNVELGCFKDLVHSFMCLQMAGCWFGYIFCFLGIFVFLEDAPMFFWGLFEFQKQDYSVTAWILLKTGFVFIELIHISIPLNVCLNVPCTFMTGYTTTKLVLKKMQLEADNITNLSVLISKYRRLEVYNKICNSWWRSHFQPSLVLVVYVVLTYSAYISIICPESLPTLVYLMFPNVTFFLVIVILTVYSELAEVYKISEEIRGKILLTARANVTATLVTAQGQAHNYLKFQNYRLLVELKRAMSLHPLSIQIGFYGKFTTETAWCTIQESINSILTLLSF